MKTELTLKSTTVVVEVLVHVEVERPAMNYDKPQDALQCAIWATQTDVASPVAKAVELAIQGKYTVCRVAATAKAQRVVSALATFEEPPPT